MWSVESQRTTRDQCTSTPSEEGAWELTSNLWQALSPCGSLSAWGRVIFFYYNLHTGAVYTSTHTNSNINQIFLWSYWLWKACIFIVIFQASLHGISMQLFAVKYSPSLYTIKDLCRLVWIQFSTLSPFLTMGIAFDMWCKFSSLLSFMPDFQLCIQNKSLVHPLSLLFFLPLSSHWSCGSELFCSCLFSFRQAYHILQMVWHFY